MPKLKKIKKKKSFMFSSRHQSDVGVMSLLLGLASFAGMIACVIVSFAGRGETALRLGAVGMFAAVADVVGIVAGFISLGERDIFLWLPRTALIINACALALWITLVVMGVRG